VSHNGGTVASLTTADTADGQTVVFAATAIGLHRSNDAGRTWTAASVGSIAPFVEVVAASPNFANDRTLFVGTRTGLYRSLDGGETWELVLVGSRMLSIAVSPAYAKENLLFAGTETDGALRSPDAGRSWTSANPGLLELTVLALAFSPAFERDLTGFAATAAGLYRTRNGGRSWRAIETELEDPAVQCLAISPDFADDQLVLAGTEADGLLRSDDAGQTWEVVADLGSQGITALAFSSPRDGQRTIAAATADGIALSDDGGQTWRTVGHDLGPVLTLAFVPSQEGEVLLAGLPRDGVARSTDLGQTWQPANEGLSARLLVSLAVSPAFAADGTLVAAGLEEGISLSTDGGQTWQPSNKGLDDTTVFGVAASPGFASDHTLFAATAAGVYRSRDAGQSWQLARATEQPEPAAGVVVGAADDGQSAPVLVALQGGRLVLSEDGGEGWRVLSPPFAGAEIISLGLSPTFAQDRTLFVGAGKPLPDGASTDLTLWRSTDGGERWERWLVDRGDNVLPLAVPATYPASKTLFVGLAGRVLRPLSNVQELRAGARRPMWDGVDLGGGAVTALAVSPGYRDDATVFAATSAGVFVSRDGGQSFEPWSEGLEPASVVALTVSPNYVDDRIVYAIGLGGAIWRRKDA
jgi:photosystem II stability/assembly factor-like uncharacterized protein